MNRVESESQGHWRIFSKVGDGYSSSRNVGEAVLNGYACLPQLDGNGKAIPNAGVEFVISAESSVANDTTLQGAQALIQAAIAKVVAAIYSGQIQ